jgi:hypothetical protein
MRYMIIIKSTGHREAGIPDTAQHVHAVSAYRRSLEEAGILLAAEELLPSSLGTRITYSADGDLPRVQSGPFPAADGMLVAEIALIEAASEEEALSLALRVPVPAGCGEFAIELRGLKEQRPAVRAHKDWPLEFDLQNHLHMLRKTTYSPNQSRRSAKP